MKCREEEIDVKVEGEKEIEKRGRGRGKERNEEDTKVVIDFTQDPSILNYPITNFHSSSVDFN